MATINEQQEAEAAADSARLDGAATATAGLEDDALEPETPATILIAGAGIVGLVLALALKEHLGITAELYEQAAHFQEDVGAGMGMYPNGLRVIRDISPTLLKTIRESGCPFGVRRWERHDGTQIVSANDSVLGGGDEEVQSMGIRRWRLQKALFDAVCAADIPVHFQKRTSNVLTREDGLVEISFEDGSKRLTRILFAADGGKSAVRQLVADPATKLEYTGVTCIMGMADCAPPQNGLTFMTASTTQCHAVYFPTMDGKEQCFQLHFPVSDEKADPLNWGTLRSSVGRQECLNMANELRKDGWDERYIAPLEQVTRAVLVGFCTLQPRLPQWVYGSNRRIVLVGDAAHPPVPYTGQGAQMGIEDAGTIALLLKSLCLDSDNKFDLTNFGLAMDIYEEMRIPRTGKILDVSAHFGSLEQRRAESAKFDIVQAERMQRQVFFHLTLPAFLPGCEYNYRDDVKFVISQRFKDKQ